MFDNWLTFSDSAKFADIAKNIINGFGYGSNFSFWSLSIYQFVNDKMFSLSWIPPMMPFSIAAFFKIFGVGDFAVMATSVFYFILTLLFTFLLAKKVFNSNLVGIISTLAIGFNKDIINYAITGASESPFIFEIVAASYFISIKKKWATVVSFLLLVLMYFTRPQAFIYIVGIILYWLLINFKIKKALLYFVGILVGGLLVDYFILVPLSGRNFLYSVIGRGFGSSFNQSSVASNALRGAVDLSTGGITQILKNIFYNLYNFYKLMPQIMNPYLFALFGLGVFFANKDHLEKSFKISSLFMLMLTLLVTAASIPFFRYLHPVVPLIYIFAVGTLVEIISKLGVLNSKFKILIPSFLIIFFAVGQTLGIYILDARFERDTHNVDKPPVYVELAGVLKENTGANNVIITNLDTWGSWYGERKTVWFPIEPKQLIDPSTGKIPFDAIYLTSYLIDDANYYMGENWRLIFNNPTDSKKWTCEGCDEIAREFTLKNIYSIDQKDNYERQDAKAVLLVRK